jgi:Fe-S oxidoreductase
MIRRTPLEISLFLVVLAVSLYAFWRNIRPALRAILSSRRDPDFRLAPLAARVREFLWEVVCQAKVIRERPLPGLAHAFVFWGFCAFSLVTLDHFAAGFGFDALRMDEGWFGPFWFSLAFAFALLVSVSILGLAIRRFLVRPKWLGDSVSPESGLIAALILALMLTYIADYALHPDPNGAAGKMLWWGHSLALLIFLPLIPTTKHLHLLLSPATVFLSRGGFSRIPPLAGDDDFGLVEGKDVTRLLALQAYSCVECGRCQEHCPAHATGKELNPKQIALGLRTFLKQNGPNAAQPLLGAHLSEEAVFQCTTCGACEYQCPVGIEHLPLIVGLRRGAVNTGRWEDEYGGELFLKLERNGNPLGMSQIERDRFIQKSALPLFDGTQDYCLWLGCMGAYDPQGRETVLALAEVLRALGVSFGVLKKEKCTGDSARRLGNDLAFQQLAEFNLQQFEAAGVKRMISICPHCVRTLNEDYREFSPPDGFSWRVEHHSVFLSRHSSKLLTHDSREKVVYHDPCYLGRDQDVYEEPRSIAAKGGSLVEARKSRDRSFCCGAGGGLAFLGEEKGTRVSYERAGQLLETGADVVAAACPFCATMFRDALAAVKPEGTPRLLDIAQIAAASLRKDVTSASS